VTGSTVKSQARADRMKARWADPEAAARMRENLAKGRAKRTPSTGLPGPAGEGEPKGNGAPAPAPFTDRRLFGRRRSR
jgi:hypothetical protein